MVTAYGASTRQNLLYEIIVGIENKEGLENELKEDRIFVDGQNYFIKLLNYSYISSVAITSSIITLAATCSECFWSVSCINFAKKDELECSSAESSSTRLLSPRRVHLDCLVPVSR